MAKIKPPFDHMHSLVWRQCNLQTDSEPRLVHRGARHTRIQWNEMASEILDRAGHGESVRGGRCRLIEQEVEF